MGVSGSSWCLLGLKNLGDSQSPDEWQDHAHARAADSLLEYYVNSGFSSSPDAWNWFATGKWRSGSKEGLWLRSQPIPQSIRKRSEARIDYYSTPVLYIKSPCQKNGGFWHSLKGQIKMVHNSSNYHCH